MSERSSSRPSEAHLPATWKSNTSPYATSGGEPGASAAIKRTSMDELLLERVTCMITDNLFFLPGLELGLGRRVRRIQSEDAAPFLHLHLDPVLELRLRLGFFRYFIDHFGGNDHHAFSISHHHVARIDRDAAAADR